jgi:hypothetical protein
MNILAWFRRFADAVSHAETGPYSGAPRNPTLNIDDRTYSTVRYTTNRVAYTATSTSADRCSRCGQPLAETHELDRVQDEDARLPLGAVRACRGCDPNSWLHDSRMPRAKRARDQARKYVV